MHCPCLQATVSGFSYVTQANVFKVCDQPHPLKIAKVGTPPNILGNVASPLLGSAISHSFKRLNKVIMVLGQAPDLLIDRAQVDKPVCKPNLRVRPMPH